MYIVTESSERIDDLSVVETLVAQHRSFFLEDVEILQHVLERLDEILKAAEKSYRIDIDYGYCTNYALQMAAWMIGFVPVAVIAVSMLWRMIHFNPDFFPVMMFGIYAAMVAVLWYFKRPSRHDYRIVVHLQQMSVEVITY